MPAARWLEAGLLVAATAGVGLLETTDTPLLFLGFPLLIWAAFRFRLAGAAPCALAVSTFAIMAATGSKGPFARHDLVADMITLQAFNASAALTALLLAAVISERNQSQREIAQACGRLADMVSRIATGDQTSALPDDEVTGRTGPGTPLSPDRTRPSGDGQARGSDERPSPHP